MFGMDKSSSGEISQNEPLKEEPLKKEPSKEEPSKEEPSKEEPSKEEPSKEEPLKEEPLKKEPSKDRPSKDELSTDELSTDELYSEETPSVKNEVGEVIDTEKEQRYQKTVNLMKSISCMAMCTDKVDMYKQLAKQFTKLSGYKASNASAEECKQLAKQINKDIKKAIYKRAQSMKKDAKLASDYRAAGNEFRKVSGYRDSDDMVLECDKMSIRMERKSTKKKLVNYGIAMVCIFVVMFGATTSHAKYYFANTLMLTDSYNSAIKIYKKLGTYKDCVERLTQCHYQNGFDLEEVGDYQNAEKAFAAAGDYKDSEEQKVKMEKQIIKNSKTGKTVRVGNCDWILLDLEQNKALLMKKKALTGRAYNEKLTDTTWETSTLRDWLNTKFIEETFSRIERSNIILFPIVNGENAKYGTSGGNDTRDDIFLLSMEEAEKYNSQFPPFKSNSWLRSPGYNQSSAAFLSVEGAVMDYGYVITSEEITVRPVFWFVIN